MIEKVGCFLQVGSEQPITGVTLSLGVRGDLGVNGRKMRPVKVIKYYRNCSASLLDNHLPSG